MNISHFFKLQRRIYSVFRESYINGERKTLCEQEVVNNPKSFYLSGHLDRIAGTGPNTTIQKQIDLILSPTITHAACSIIEISQAKIYTNFISNKKYLYPLDFESHHRNSEYPEKILISSRMFSYYWFGHFIHDDLPAILLAEDLNLKFSLPYLLEFNHANQYLGLLSRTIQFLPRGFCGDMKILFDYGENSYKASRYKRLRESIRCIYARQHKHKTATNVFIKRGMSGAKRTLQNEDQLIKFLEARQWKIVAPESMTASELISELIDCSMIMSVEGSALSHALITIKSGGSLIVLQPPRRFECVYKSIMNAIDVKFGFYVCADGRSSDTFFIDDFKKLEQLIETMQEG